MDDDILNKLGRGITPHSYKVLPPNNSSMAGGGKRRKKRLSKRTKKRKN
jgi:hypothetical protein